MQSEKCKIQREEYVHGGWNTSQRRGGFWGVISRGRIEGSGIRRKEVRYVHPFAIRPRGPGGWWTYLFFALASQNIGHWGRPCRGPSKGIEYAVPRSAEWAWTPLPPPVPMAQFFCSDHDKNMSRGVVRRHRRP